MSFRSYRLTTAPPWYNDDVAQATSAGLGDTEDSLVLSTTQAMQARLPSSAPTDTPNGSTSLALNYIGNDRALAQTFVPAPPGAINTTWQNIAGSSVRAPVDVANPVNAFRAWIESGFSTTPVQVGAQIRDGNILWTWTGLTFGTGAGEGLGANGTLWSNTPLAWQTETPYALGTQVGAGGLIWIATNDGISGDGFPFPLGPANPLAPGFGAAGTDAGLSAALINSGFWDTAADGTLVGPRFYYTHNFDRGTGDPMNVRFVGASLVARTIDVETIAGGTPGIDGSVKITVRALANWAADTDYAVGDTRLSALGTQYICVVPGRSGAVTPFTNAAPNPSVWPPTEAMIANQGVVYDNGVQWLYSTFSPIPETLPIGTQGSAQTPAVLTATSDVFPLTTGGGTVAFTLNGLDFAATIPAGVVTEQQVIDAFNVAIVAVGALNGVASDSGGMLQLSSEQLGAASTVTIENTALVASLGFTTLTAQGESGISGGTWGLEFGGPLETSDHPVIEYDPQPPDGRTDAFARLWMVLPVRQLLLPPRWWGLEPWLANQPDDGYAEGSFVRGATPSQVYKCTTASGMESSGPAPSGTTFTDASGAVWTKQAGDAGDPDNYFDGLWGHSPGGDASSPAVAWGTSSPAPQNGQDVYGLIWSLTQWWLAAHIKLVGCWVVWGTRTQLDEVPQAPWDELTDVTIDGVHPPFFRFSGTAPGVL